MKRLWFLILIMALVLAAGITSAREGTMYIEGIPDDATGGRYDTQASIFYGDVTGFADGIIRVVMDETEIRAVILEWHTRDDYMKAVAGVTVLQNDVVITSDSMEYFGETDEAHFLGAVVVEMDDGRFTGQRFVLNLETEEMQFFGAFSGEFRD